MCLLLGLLSPVRCVSVPAFSWPLFPAARVVVPFDTLLCPLCSWQFGSWVQKLCQAPIQSLGQVQRLPCAPTAGHREGQLVSPLATSVALDAPDPGPVNSLGLQNDATRKLMFLLKLFCGALLERDDSSHQWLATQWHSSNKKWGWADACSPSTLGGRSMWIS